MSKKKNNKNVLGITAGVLLLLIIVVMAFLFKDTGAKKDNSSNAQAQTQTNSQAETKKEEVKQDDTTKKTEDKKVEETKDTSSKEVKELKIEVLKAGTGDRVTKEGDGISVNYLGTLTDGTKFDSSYDRNQAFTFDLGAGQVIKGWDQGLIGMKLGEKRKITIPASLGYGDRAIGKIPANSTLIFEVELVGFKN